MAETPDLPRLLRHVLLQVANAPPKGGGVIVYIDLISAGLRFLLKHSGSGAIEDWLKEATSLRVQLVAQKEGGLASPNSHDLKDPLWKRLHLCVAAYKPIRQVDLSISALLALGTLHAIERNTSISQLFVEGIHSLYKSAAKSTVHADWRTISSVDILSRSSLELVLPKLISASRKKFVAHALAILETPAVNVASVNLYPQRYERSSSTDDNKSPPIAPVVSKPDPDRSSKTTKKEVSGGEIDQDEAARRFESGDSILLWHATRAAFAHRNERLTLQSWESLPVELTIYISRALSSILSGEVGAKKPAASLGLLSLFTSTPLHVLLHADLMSGADFYIDLEHGCFVWCITDLINIKINDDTEIPDDSRTTGAQYFRIPLPEVIVQYLRSLQYGEVAATIHELFGVAPDSPEWDALIGEVRELLRELGDPAYPANPGRWVNSIARMYVETAQSDLMAAVCSCSFELTSISALHYFHPSGREIEDACKDVYQKLGLGPIASIFLEEGAVVKNIPSDQELKSGFWSMEMDMRAHFKCIRSRTTAQRRLDSFNALVDLSAASFVFFTGSRGSKIEEIRVGSVYFSDEIVHLDDKDVLDERGSRLIPKTEFLNHVLARLGHAQLLIGKLLAASLQKDQGDKWRELARSEFRFDAIAFQTIDCVKGRYCGKPLTAKTIERIARAHFSRGKNFMRHVLITRWSTARLDRNLLRLITGHSRSGLQVPALGAVYSPKSAIAATRQPLQQMLAQWVPQLDPAELVDFKPVFLELPGRRVHKNHQAHRQDLLLGISGPRFDRWHLAAYEITTAVRTLLLNDHAPINPWADLWLHLLVFDGLHEESDLASIFSDLEHSLELGESGWTYKFRRKGNRDAHVNVVQAPTAVLLHSLSPLLASKKDLPGAYASIVNDAGDWLRAAYPKAWGGHKAQAATSSVPDILMSNVRLWCDLCVATALQYSYEPKSKAAMLDSRSASRILGLVGEFSDPVPPKAPAYHRSFHIAQQLKDLFTLVNEIGDNDKPLGEIRERANQMTARLQGLGASAPNSWPDMLVRCIRQNIKKVLERDQHRLEFSSLSTYLGYLRPNLKVLAAELPGDYDDIDWLEVSHALRAIDHADAEVSQERQESQDDAANWLLKTLRDDGVSIPDGALTKTQTRTLLPTTSHPIVHVEDKQLDRVGEVLALWFHEAPIHALRAELTMELLRSAPLRWGELSCINRRDLVRLMPLFCIQPSGFSQIKSYLSKRLLPMSARASTLCDTLLKRLTQAQQPIGHREFLFLDWNGGDTDRAQLYWLHSAITEVLRAFTANPNVRVHTLRARFISNQIFPGWRRLLGEWLSGSLGPTKLAEFFQYSTETAWRIDQSRCMAGHSQDRTTLGFYVYPSFQVRAMALAATLTEHRPTTSLVATISTMAAFKKQMTRVEAVRTDPWIFIQQHTARKQRRISASAQIANAPRDDVTVEEQEVFQITTPDIQFVALLLAGCDNTEATDKTHLRTSRANFLEKLISKELEVASSLRQRIRGGNSGRAFSADRRALVSDKGQTFATLALRLGRQWNEELLALLTQRPTKVPWHQSLLEIESGFEQTPWAIESICDVRYEDTAVSVRLLNQRANLVASAPQRAVGLHPRIFVCLKPPKHQNTVLKARLTVMARLLCNAYLLLKSEDRA